MGYKRVDPRTPVYAEFTRLYRIAMAMRPGERDDWNGDLYARDDTIWGSIDPASGAISLNSDLVLRYLIGRQWASHDAEQAQALQTVLHEAYHLRVKIDSPNELNAHRGPASNALDEGLTEFVAKRDVRAFARHAGYGRLGSDRHAYPEAYLATVSLLGDAVGPGVARTPLAARALDRPVVMRWDVIATHIVKQRLALVLPDDPHHHRAARADLIRAMAHSAWDGLEVGLPSAGHIAAHHTSERTERAVLALQTRYGQPPDPPDPGAPPNAGVPRDASRPREQQRRGVAIGPRRPSPAKPADLAAAKVLLGTAPAAGAARRPTAKALSGQVRRTGPGHTHPGPSRPG